MKVILLINFSCADWLLIIIEKKTEWLVLPSRSITMNWVSKQANINLESRGFDVIVTGCRDGAVVRALAWDLFLDSPETFRAHFG